MRGVVVDEVQLANGFELAGVARWQLQGVEEVMQGAVGAIVPGATEYPVVNVSWSDSVVAKGRGQCPLGKTGEARHRFAYELALFAGKYLRWRENRRIGVVPQTNVKGWGIDARNDHDGNVAQQPRKAS